MYLKNPQKIEASSMEIIEQGLDAHSLRDEELQIVKRCIHSTGDFGYQHIISLTPNAVEAGIEAIRAGCRIVTDTSMVYAGINKRALEKAGCCIECYVAHDEAFRLAKEQGITRSMAAVDLAVQKGVDIFVIGNAPTALYRLGEYIEKTCITPELIVGVPVGFVGAAESKEYLRALHVPSISTIGTQGGSNVAAAIMNAIIYMAVGRA
ncbi:precorrin-8X methylmutase [candidate division KSB3 bacterium]|uniref:Precorrin-8X methylmutase n=1 Tax=candidate division KSB3 bacterium TaxID=2044937 RepID=A0A2G6E9S6_9BACT|nr:MAG: precorrin-8X methylmutase [candidate division KSB3 bacterium]PIE30904.1 MAG: precorrin-8X methylmutase [candidate division KSB3 bacterium]